MQLTVAEDLLRNTENLAIVIGDVLDVTSGNINNSNMTITQENISMYTLIMLVITYYISIHCVF